jgi:hypothetical protein
MMQIEIIDVFFNCKPLRDGILVLISVFWVLYGGVFYIANPSKRALVKA